MTLVLGTIFFIFFVFLLKKWTFFRDSGIQFTHLLIVLLLKITVSWGMIWIYTHVYKDLKNNDIHKYYNDSAPIFKTLTDDPKTFVDIFFLSAENEKTKQVYRQTNNWYRPYSALPSNDNRLVIRLNVLLRIVSLGGNLWVHAIIMSFLMMIAAIWLYSLFKRNKDSTLLFFGIGLFPSLAFWTGPVMKESILILALSGFLYSLWKLTSKKYSLPLLVLFLISLLIMSYIKVYFLLLLLPGLVVFLLKKVQLNFYLQLIGLYLVLLLGSFTWDAVGTNLVAESVQFQRDSMTNVGRGGVYFKNEQYIFYATDQERSKLKVKADSTVIIESTVNVIQRPAESPLDTVSTKLKPNEYKDLKIYFDQKRSGSFHEIPTIEPRTLSLIQNTPFALFNAVLRPFPSMKNGVMVLISFGENLLFLLLVVLAFVFPINKHRMEKRWTHLIWSSSIMLLILVGLTTPIDGAIVRYRMPAFYLIAIWCIAHTNYDLIKNRLFKSDLHK